MLENETAANPADGSLVTHTELAPVDSNPAPQTEATAPAEGADDSLEQLAKEALGETDAKPEYVEIELDGRKYKVLAADDQPVDPDLKFGALRDADYRKKTMTLAEERKALEQERVAYQQRANLEGQAAVMATQLTALETQINQYANISIDHLRQQGWTDQQIAQAQAELADMVAQRDGLSRQVNDQLERFRQMDTESVTKARADAIANAHLADKALTPERCQQLETFAVEGLGLSADDVATITDAKAYKVLHLANIGQQFIERQRAAGQMSRAAAGKPATNVGGTAKPGGNPEDMSPAEYIAWRNAGNG